MNNTTNNDNLTRAILMAEGTVRSAPQTGHTGAEVLDGNRDVFETMFGKAVTDEAFDRALELSFEISEAPSGRRSHAGYKHPITVGTSWVDAGGRTWEVWECLPFGKYRVRTADRSRIGEMYGRDIRTALASAPTHSKGA